MKVTTDGINLAKNVFHPTSNAQLMTNTADIVRFRSRLT